MSDFTVVELTTPDGGVLKLLPEDLHTWHYESSQCRGIGSPLGVAWDRGEPSAAEVDFIYEALFARARYGEAGALSLSIVSIVKSGLEDLAAGLEDLQAELSALPVKALPAN